MKKNFGSWAIVLLLISVVACKDQKQSSSSETASEQRDSLMPSHIKTPSIVPGERLEGIVLGEPGTKILDSLGHPKAGDAAMGKAVGTWTVSDLHGDASLTLFTSRKMGVEDFSRILQIRTTASKYKDEHHLGVGDSLATIERVYTLKKVGRFTENRVPFELYESPQGIAFEVNKNGLVKGIVIHKPNRQTRDIYLPLYKDFQAIPNR